MLDLEGVLAFAHRPQAPACEVRVNFGVFSGRTVTVAELDDLAHALISEVGHVTIVSEERRELSANSEIALHQVRIELADDADVDRVVELAERWAESCIAERHIDVAEA